MSTDTVHMIEGKGNMLTMLDDESKRPGASDVTYTSGLNNKFSRHIRFGMPELYLMTC